MSRALAPENNTVTAISDIREEFEIFMKVVLEALSDNQVLKEQNRELKRELESVTNNLTLVQNQLSARSAEATERSKEILSLYRSNATVAEELSRELSSHEQSIRLKYELDMAISAKRSLERELDLQKAENERLQRQLQLHSREVTSSEEIEYMRQRIKILEKQISAAAHLVRIVINHDKYLLTLSLELARKDKNSY